MGKKKPIVTPFGQWAYPGEITVIPSNTITMKGVDYPVMGIDNLGNSELMLPGGEYTFPGDYVTEIPQMGKGGLTQWFAEEWTDVKTGKPCGRSGKEKGSRPYPACRPKKRVNETTPKTTSEMSSAEKAKFKREKTSGKRIDYNHKRRQKGGEQWYTTQEWEDAMPDSTIENIVEFLDPTGILSHDDARRAYREWKQSKSSLPTSTQALDMFGAVPALGKLGKLKYLADPNAMKAVYKYFPWQDVLNAVDTVQDEYDKKRGGQIGWLDSYQDGGDPEMMFRNKYNTNLTQGQKKKFDKWIAEESARQGRDVLMDIGAYDVQGFWKSGDYKKMDSDNHGFDTWKKPNHPTFSNQSRYHGADGWYGGNWTDNAGYQPSKQTLETYGPEYYNWMFKSEPGRSEYLDMSRYESGANAPTPFVYQKGGWLKSYQDAGEASTEQNPELIGQVHVRAKDKGWFDNYIKRPLRKFGRSYAQRISDATGGSEWYKQANPFMNLAFESINAPQYAATYAVTGKVQTPSEAMNIQNPYGAFAVDAVLDPTNLLGAGLLKQPVKNLGRNIVNSPNNIGNAKLYDKVVNIDSFLGEGIGELIAGRKNRKALSEGNTWLKNWIADPITQNKIENDLVWASQRQDQYGLGYQQAKSFVPNVREYPLSEQMKDFFIRKEGNIHAGNSGISYLHNESPITRQRRLIDEQIGIAPGISMKYYGSWVSRNPAIKQSLRKSTVIHEGTHDWTTNFLLNNSGQADAIKNLYSDKIKNISEQWKNLRKQGISPSQVMGEQNANLGYLADPTEVHARIMELRQLMKMTPEQSVMVTPEKAQNIIRSIENPKNAKFIDPKFLDVIDKDPKKLAALFNRLWAAPAATALGASQLQEKKYGGWLDSYQSGGETSTEQNPTRIAPVDIRVKRKKVSDSNRYMYDAEGNLVYNPSLDIYPLIAEGSTQEETTFQPNLPVDLLNPTLEELVNVAGPYYPIDNRLASGDRINLPASDLQRSLEQDYILPQMVGRSFGNLPLNRGDDIDDGYGPSRRWTTNLNEHPGNYFLYSPETYAYVLKADKSSLVDFDKKRQVESGMSNLDQRFNEALANQGYNSEMVDDYTANRPNQIWNRAEQARVEMLNNPEIREWARLHNLDLSNKYRDKYDKEVAAAETDDGFASKIPESVYANRLVKAGLPTSRPDYDYRNIKTFIIQDPSKFNLAGYFPIDQEMINSANNASYKNLKKIMAERMGIDSAKFDTGEYLIHYNRSPISEYTPGMKNGGWLNKYK